MINSFPGKGTEQLFASLTRNTIEQTFLPTKLKLVNLITAIKEVELEVAGTMAKSNDVSTLPEENNSEIVSRTVTRKCPGSAECYRDCREDVNRVTGAKFKSINAFFDVLNPLLPDLETNTNLRFDISYITNIQNCGTSCALAQSIQPDFGYPLSIFIDSQNPLSGPRDYFSQYSPFVDERLNNGNVSYFLAKAIGASASRPSGSRLIGSVGRHDKGRKRAYMSAYVIATNWSNIDIRYMNRGNGDWDPSLFGDNIHVNITETDILGATKSINQTTTGQQTRTFNVSLVSTAALKFGEVLTAGQTNTVGYTFQNQQTRSASTTYTLTADRIVELGTYVFVYCDSPTTPFTFPLPAIIPYAFPQRGTQTNNWSWGWTNAASYPSPDPFSLGSNSALPFSTSTVDFISIISK